MLSNTLAWTQIIGYDYSYFLPNKIGRAHSVQGYIGLDLKDKLNLKLSLGLIEFSGEAPNFHFGATMRQDLFGNERLKPILTLSAEYYRGNFATVHLRHPTSPINCVTSQAFSLSPGAGLRFQFSNWSIPIVYTVGWFKPVGRFLDESECMANMAGFKDEDIEFTKNIVATSIRIGIEYRFTSN